MISSHNHVSGNFIPSGEQPNEWVNALVKINNELHIYLQYKDR